MNPIVFAEFERICSGLRIQGRVLEVGAVPSKNSLLCMKSLANVSEKIGIDLLGSSEFEDIKIIGGNANQMDCFEDNSFDAVLCNATLEHDRFFWKTIAEMRRVLKPGGCMVVGVPGFQILKGETLKKTMGKLPLICRLRHTRIFNFFFMATLTYRLHNHPGDYYRFSHQALKEVFFEDMEDIRICSVMLPPRLIGTARKKMVSE